MRRNARHRAGHPPGDITLGGGSFRYPGAAAALTDIHCTFRAGERVGLVGENGSGKTTLVKVRTGLFQPTEGRVLLGAAICARSTGRNCATGRRAVFQDHIRYALTLHDNIGYGRHERMGERPAVEAAALRGGADEVASALPDGYETLLTRQFSGGTDLSGGQWQRVAVSAASCARRRWSCWTNDGRSGRSACLHPGALRPRSPPTHRVSDSRRPAPKAEADVFRRFAAVAGDRTAVLVSHRLGSARLCDRVLVLHEGRLVKQGTHGELVVAGSAFARLWAVQGQWYR